MSSPSQQKELKWAIDNLYKKEMVAYLQEKPEAFDEALKLAVSAEKRYGWRSAWLLWSVMEENDQRIRPVIGKIVEVLPTTSTQHQRELIKVLLKMDIDEGYEAILFDHCEKMWLNTGNNPSTRYNAMLMLIGIARKHPQLLSELEVITQETFMGSLSPVVQRSIQRELKKPKKSGT